MNGLCTGDLPSLRELDLSNNVLGQEGKALICGASEKRQERLNDEQRELGDHM